jgi:hypothetical protein
LQRGIIALRQLDFLEQTGRPSVDWSQSGVDAQDYRLCNRAGWKWGGDGKSYQRFVVACVLTDEHPLPSAALATNLAAQSEVAAFRVSTLVVDR